jgi:protein-S-isoprenylcysteine O-methyltransferase Ste14
METTATAPNAGVKFPPPLVYVAGIVAGWLLDRAWPWRIVTPPSRWLPFVVATFIVFAFVVMISAVSVFRRARTSLIPNRPSTAFVVSGPYRFTRNPMYVSMAALYLGVAFAMNSWWPVALLVVVLLIIRHAVIAREERYLRARFPAEYPEYCRKVRRWL